jgi:nickel/cobalt exporter
MDDIRNCENRKAALRGSNEEKRDRMGTAQLTMLLWSAASIGLIHTLLGPDHYIPFVAMARAGHWSKGKTLAVTAACGIGHVLGSVVLGLLGIALGWAVGGMEAVEALRGDWAAWALITLGLVYAVWGIRRGILNRPHRHRHAHADGSMHEHDHTHRREHAHPHAEGATSAFSPWALFVIFVLGPCEALIPLLIVPASTHSWWGLALVLVVFGVVTVATMTAVTIALLYGLNLLPVSQLERWSHALAGFALFACGGAIRWLGL